MLPFYMYVNEQGGMGAKKKEKSVYSSSSLKKKNIYIEVLKPFEKHKKINKKIKRLNPK